MRVKNLSLSVSILITILLLIGIVSASFSIGNVSHSIDKSYGPSSNINGWINMSFNQEPSNSLFSGGGNSISLIGLLKNNSDFVYDCVPTDCAIGYSVSTPELEKTFSLEKGKSKIIGLKFSNKITSVTSIKFTTESNALASKKNQLKIDLFNDNIIDAENKEISDEINLNISSCFIDTISSTKYNVGKYPNKHCQRMMLPESPGFSVGAWTENGNSLIMTLNYINGSEVMDSNGEVCSCDLGGTGATGEEKYCDIGCAVTNPAEYYVCLSIAEIYGSSSLAKMRGYYDSNNPCGFYGGVGVRPEEGSFDISAQSKHFGSMNGKPLIISNVSLGKDLEKLTKEYLIDKYGDLDCRNKDCIVPIKFISNKDQEIKISNLDIQYETTLSSANEKNFNDLIETPAKINSTFQKLFFGDEGFFVQNDYGNQTFQLKFNDEEIFSKEILIERIPIITSLSPLTTASAFPTTFKVEVSSFANISKYDWDFNGTKQVTNLNKATHTFPSTGEYSLVVTATDSQQRSSSKTFKIIVETPEKAINDTIKKYQKYLDTITDQLDNQSEFGKDTLEDILGLDDIENSLIDIQVIYENSQSHSEETLNEIMTALIELAVPKSINTPIKIKSISFSPKIENIDIDVLTSILGGSYNGTKKEYNEAIFIWGQKNIETKLSLESLSLELDSGSSPLLNIIELEIDKKTDDDAYLIIPTLSDLNFKEDYGEETWSGGFYIKLDKDKVAIAFSTTEDISFMDLPVFIAPQVSKLSFIKAPSTKVDDGINLMLIIMLILIVLLGVGGYIALQQWYKHKYEAYLFKNKNSMYNLITYVKNSKAKGLEDDEVKKRLKKAGWNYEQVSYVLKKYTGKRTGMFEIPIKKIMELFKKKEALSIPQGKPLHSQKPRMIKRPMMNKRKLPRTYRKPQNNLNKNKKNFI